MDLLLCSFLAADFVDSNMLNVYYGIICYGKNSLEMWAFCSFFVHTIKLLMHLFDADSFGGTR